MKLEEIRSQLLTQLQINLNYWDDVINNTNPGNYGVEDWDISISPNNFYVDIPNKTFSFKDISFTAKVLLGASHGDSSIEQDFSTRLYGKGTFDFITNKEIKIENIEISPNVNLNIY